MTGCASVEVVMPGAKPVADAEPRRERAELTASLDRLEDSPWAENKAVETDSFVQALFGGGAPSPKEDAERYLADLEGQATLTVRRDIEATLSAVWNVARNGKEAASALEPVQGDLRTLEAAIVEARRCRLVYAEALKMLGDDDPSVTRDEVRLVKSRFNQAIMELGRTADLVSTRLEGDLAPSYAQNTPAL
ncbi:hypothetical protein NOG11_10000 [Parvularcula sp. BGMRC 0090]|uniref:Uncharacterized protein n=1 Tax=Parvularcula maris TaxID=2965077 RepID=A0A9X2L9W1_9PROT|nr:hypothetical protein [Parvularcula maris]